MGSAEAGIRQVQLSKQLLLKRILFCRKQYSHLKTGILEQIPCPCSWGWGW